MSPRLVCNPTLLTGVARCGICGSGMTLRTGKGGRYRYYACAARIQKGATLCRGCAISMATLDSVVLDHLADRLLTPERVAVVLRAYLHRSAASPAKREVEVALLAGTSPATSSTITPAKVVRLSRALRDVLHNGDIAIRKAYPSMFVGQVVVSDTEIRLSGPLASAASADQLPDITMVPSFVPEWRPLRGSNPCYQRERLVS